MKVYACVRVCLCSVHSNSQSLPGSLARVSPGEQVFGFLNAIYRDFKNACQPDVMEQWHAYCLSLPFHFRTVDNDGDAHLMMLQYRQDVKADKFSMGHTLLQTVYDVAASRDRKPKKSMWGASQQSMPSSSGLGR